MSKRLQLIVTTLEAALVGLFFIQSLRFLIGSLYSRVSSASLLTAYPDLSVSPTTPGVVDVETLTIEVGLLGLFIALPLLTILLGNLRPMFVVAVALVAVGRALINTPFDPITATIAAEMAISGGLIYISLLSSQRARLIPYFFILGLVLDQVVRAAGNTLDPLLFNETLRIALGSTVVALSVPALQVLLSIVVVVISIANIILPRFDATGRTREGTAVDLNRGILTLWGAVGLGALLFLQLSLLALPNALAARADVDYTLFAPLVLLATMLPLIPEMRAQARRFIAPFDASTRGWIWLIVLALLLVIGVRVQNLPLNAGILLPIGGIALVCAQFIASMIWWWLVRPRTEDEYNVGGLWLVLSMLIFTILVGADFFTYEYAFVRDLAEPLAFLNPVVPSLLRGFRGLGLGVILLAALLSILPMLQTTRRIPWQGGRLPELLTWLVLVIGTTGLTAYLVQPPLVSPVANVDELRVATYNIHSGYSEYFDMTLPDIAATIASSGADVVLLQEVEAGRLMSFGVDQTLWLARQLGMDRRFYATNEGLYGLAVISKVPIVFDDGELLPSIDQQTGLQRVQIRPDTGVITLYNTSLGLLLQGSNLNTLEDNQISQMNTIMGIIARHINQDYGGQLGRTILGGTFHNTPRSPVMQIPRDNGFIDPFAGTNLQLSATLRRINLPPARYDYIWLWAQSLDPLGTNVIDSDASDHRLAVIGVQISRN